jgi:hypothetical protein
MHLYPNPSSDPLSAIDAPAVSHTTLTGHISKRGRKGKQASSRRLPATSPYPSLNAPRTRSSTRMAIGNVHPRTPSEQLQPSSPPQQPTNQGHLGNPESADLELGDAPGNTEANDECSDDDDDSEDEDFQDPSTNLLNANDEDEDRIHQVFKAILEPLHKDILKINKRLTTQNRKLATRLASMETKHEIALNTIATLGHRVEYLVQIQASKKDAPPAPTDLLTPAIPEGTSPKPTLWSAIASACAKKDPPKDKNGRTLNPRPLSKKQRTLVIARHSDQPVTADLTQLKLAINATLRRCHADPLANIGHVSANYKHNLVLLTADACPVDLVLAHKAAIEETVRSVDTTAQNLKKQETWIRMMVHSIDITMFPECETGMKLLKEDIEMNNNHIKLTTLPRSLTKPETRPHKKATTMVIAVRTEHEAKLIQDHGVQVDGKTRKADRYVASRPTDQCTNCQQFGHSYLRCKQSPFCNICAEPHSTTSHSCGSCPSIGKQCVHDVIQCINCKGNHRANDSKCPTITAIRAEVRAKFMKDHPTIVHA